MTPFRRYQDVAVVEHDPATRRPLEGAQVYRASISRVNTVWVTASYGNYATIRSPYLFDAASGWDAVAREYRWRLVPVCHRSDCETPVTGTPVTAEDDPLHREFCSEECRDAAAEAQAEGRYGYGVAT